MKPLIVFGCGGHGRVVVDAARAMGRLPFLVVDDNPASDSIEHVRVVRNASLDWSTLPDFDFVIAIGNNAIRAAKCCELEGRRGTPVTIRHPQTTIAESASIKAGSVVFAGVVVNPGARIGRNAILNTSCSIDHDCVLGEQVHVCPGVRLAGGVQVNEGVMIGTGAVVIPGVTIGAWSVVGAGSVVVRDVPERCVLFGNPARIIRRL